MIVKRSTTFLFCLRIYKPQYIYCIDKSITVVCKNINDKRESGDRHVIKMQVCGCVM